MRESVHTFFNVCKLVVVFITLTFFFYGFILWVTDRVDQNEREESPRGKVIKVIESYDVPNMERAEDVKNRLLFYYWFGE